MNRNISDVTDPVRAYTFIKDLSEEWKTLKSLLHSNDAESFIRNIDDERLSKAVSYLLNISGKKATKMKICMFLA